MMIKVILIAAILFVFFWFLSNRTSLQVHAWQKIGILLLSLIGIVVVISPELSNHIAHHLGVSRGADLLLYLLTLAFLFMTLNLYLKDKEERRRTVVLARKVALLEAQLRKGND